MESGTFACHPVSVVEVELLYFSGCPSYERLLPQLREIVRESGGDPAAITLRAVETEAGAAAERFLGSPTVRVDGRDVEIGAASRRDFGLKCRLYRTDEGQSPLPPEKWIRQALE
jgi:hypothetical protein